MQDCYLLCSVGAILKTVLKPPVETCLLFKMLSVICSVSDDFQSLNGPQFFETTPKRTCQNLVWNFTYIQEYIFTSLLVYIHTYWLAYIFTYMLHCSHKDLYIYKYLHKYTYMYIVHIYMYTFLHITCTYALPFSSTFTCLYSHIYLFPCIYFDIHIYLFPYIYIHIHVQYIHIHK